MFRLRQVSHSAGATAVTAARPKAPALEHRSRILGVGAAHDLRGHAPARGHPRPGAHGSQSGKPRGRTRTEATPWRVTSYPSERRWHRRYWHISCRLRHRVARLDETTDDLRSWPVATAQRQRRNTLALVAPRHGYPRSDRDSGRALLR